MILEFNKLLALILISVLFISCQSAGNRKAGYTDQEFRFHTSNEGEFVVTYSDTSTQILLHDGISYEYKLSPDGKFLAVDYTRFSNLQISILFSINENSRFSEYLNLSGIAWKNYSKKRKIILEDIINPRSRVVKLTNSEAFVKISGTDLNGKEFSEQTTISLK